MTQNEMRETYSKAYRYMAESKNPENMKAFGRVMNEMMDWMITNKPETAQDWVEKLCAIQWDNYLTQKEAEKIVNSMIPKAPWTREQWRSAMESNGYSLEEAPCYNSCALWVVMSMIYSDSSGTLTKWMQTAGKTDASAMFQLIHDLALDKLKDEDGKFDVRSYFGL